ncbi:PX-associated-domain-containing protein [Xylariomycetidae sp. FL0641]|nr:PX-associated-domain-containing protein [Xylariomycetidae sp. FL0641]
MHPPILTPTQLQALLDILVHYETYSEVQSFRDPKAIDRYGYPFIDFTSTRATTLSTRSASPLLQLLLTRVVLPIPGIRDVTPDFWHTKFKGIMKRLGEAELSESYDKGTLGSRKRLATAASVVHEVITRGLLSGVSKAELHDLRQSYDHRKAESLDQAWNDCVHQLVYGNLLDEIFDQFTASPDFEAHSPGVKAAVEYAIFYIATFVHQLFVFSAEGPYLLKLLENVHKLFPYSLVGQTLRVGNAASMINAMVRLFLAKVSVGAMTNWIGLTQNASDGMNLLQRIISMIMEWDTSDFRKTVEKIKQSDKGVSDKHLAAIDEHLHDKRGLHELSRQKSIEEQKSIILVIFESRNPGLAEGLTEPQHTLCLEYYAAQLAIRDREKIVEVLCRQTPDLTTSIVKDTVAVFEPMIRTIHKQVDLRKHLGAFEGFLTDFIATSKPKHKEGDEKGKTSAPSVEDYVRLLQRNRHLLYEYLHDFAKGCPELRDTWKAWAKDAVKVFRRKADNEGFVSANERSMTTGGAGDMGPCLEHLFESLPISQREGIAKAIDAHMQYLSTLTASSKQRTQRVIDSIYNDEKDSGGGDMTGPGVYAARWQSLLDETLITPATLMGPPRRGEDVKAMRALGKTEIVGTAETWETDEKMKRVDDERPPPPDVSAVVDAFGSAFKARVAQITSEGLPKA